MATTNATETLGVEPSLAIAFGDFFAAGAYQAANTHFLAAVVSAVLFGIATFLKLGPDEA